MTDTKRIRELLAEYTQATPRIGHLITLELPALLDENESLKAEVGRLRERDIKWEQKFKAVLANRGVKFIADNGWIPVSERLPDDDAVLVYTGIVERGHYHNGRWSDDEGRRLSTAYWQPLPPAPEGEK